MSCRLKSERDSGQLVGTGRLPPIILERAQVHFGLPPFVFTQVVVPGDAGFPHQVAAIFCRIVATCWWSFVSSLPRCLWMRFLASVANL